MSCIYLQDLVVKPVVKSYHLRKCSHEPWTMLGRFPVLTVKQLFDLATPNLIFDP